MRRRDFITWSAGALGIAGFYGTQKPAAAADSRHLVETAGKRAEYLARMLKRMCTEIGPHPVGSPESELVKEIVMNEMRIALPDVQLDSFTFDRWTLSGEPSLTVGGTAVEAYPRINTSGTPGHGVSGIVAKTTAGGAPQYGIADDGSGEFLAYLAPYNGTARPTHAGEGETRRLPTVNIGKDDVPLIERAITDRTPVTLVVPVKKIPGVEISNVIGTLPGETKDELLFLAHYDSVYTSPGANDNAASVIIMLMIAHAFSGSRPRKTMRFAATTCEERNNCMGAAHYAERRKREGTLSDIRFIVNFDSGTWNPDMQIWSEDRGLRELCTAIDNELRLNGTPIPVERTGFTLDAKPFAESGARAIYVESSGQDKPYLWHRPDDTPGNVQEFIVETNYRMFHEFARRVMIM